MSNRWTIKEMEGMNPYHFAACILSERRNTLNPYSPLAKKLAEAIGALEKLQADTPAKAADAREFKVETPLGALRVYASTKDDNPENFPGVFVDLLHANAKRGTVESLALTCVEYHSLDKELRTVCWVHPEDDDVDTIIHHDLTTLEEDDDNE